MSGIGASAAQVVALARALGQAVPALDLDEDAVNAAGYEGEKGYHGTPSGTGQQKGAKFPTSKAHISAVFHSFRLIFGRAIISRNGLEAWMLFPERARAAHSR